MRKLLPFGLLIPPILIVGLFVASRLGYPVPCGNASELATLPTTLLLGAAPWTLLFLIVYGHLQRWRSVKVFLVTFVVWKFSAILYHQFIAAVPVGRLLLELAGASVIVWLMFGFFWPTSSKTQKRFKRESVQTSDQVR